MSKFKVLVQHIIPQHALSKLAGFFTNSRKNWIKNPLIDWFIEEYKVDMREAVETDPHRYETFNAFFTRALKPGTRPLPADPHKVISPVDGAVCQFGKIESGKLFQAKDFYYDLNSLMGNSPYASEFQNGMFITLYLAPKDYHRVHMPCTGALQEMRYVPGKLYSVNPVTVDHVPQLFTRNERVIATFKTDFGYMAVILVGAMIVGNIHMDWTGAVNSERGNEIASWNYVQQKIKLNRGDAVGHFQLGSTVIVLFSGEPFEWNSKIQINQSVKFGESVER